MEEVAVIHHKVENEEKSLRRVAKELGISRNTVRKYLKTPEPKRVEKQPRRCPVLEKAAPRIEELLEEWKDRQTPKQRITGTRIHERLVEEGYQVGSTTVRAYLAEKKRQAAEVYIPLEHRPGEEAQVDFFEVTVEEKGERKKAWKFVMRLMYAGWDFAWLYERCDQVSFLDGHVRAFQYFNEIPRRCVYDNLSAAVKKVASPNRELTDRFQALASYYLFEPCFARVGEGHDKGGVESRGKGIRLQHLTPIPQGDSLAAISEELMQKMEKATAAKKDVQGRSAAGKIEEERRQLRALPLRPFDASRLVPVSISSQSTVRLEGALYSLPSHWARLDAAAYVGVDQVRIVCRGGNHDLSQEAPGREADLLSALSARAGPQAASRAASGSRVDGGVGGAVPALVETLGGDARRQRGGPGDSQGVASHCGSFVGGRRSGGADRLGGGSRGFVGLGAMQAGSGIADGSRSLERIRD